MFTRGLVWVAALALLAAPVGVNAYPGGTPDFQTDAAPYCAACHASLTVEVLEGAGPRADKELSTNKHLALILQGQGPYEKLSEADRATLAQQIQSVAANSKIEFVDYPPQVKPGESFNVTVTVSGGFDLAFVGITN